MNTNARTPYMELVIALGRLVAMYNDLLCDAGICTKDHLLDEIERLAHLDDEPAVVLTCH